MTAPRLKIIAAMFPLDRATGTWSLAGHLVSGETHVCTVSGQVKNWFFEPEARKAKRGRKPDTGRSIAVYLAYRVASHLENSEPARRVKAASMVLLGNSKQPENQERSVREKLSEKKLKPLLASIMKDGGGIAYVIAHEGKGHSAFLVEQGIPDSPDLTGDELDGLSGWFWQEGMRAADYGTLHIKVRRR